MAANTGTLEKGTTMPKGYWIAHIDITDPEGYRAYMPLSREAIAAFGGQVIIRGGPSQVVEGATRARHVMVEFPSLADAQACYNSEIYTKAREIRQRYSQSEFIIVEGA